jgi:hypothetical protein
MTREPINLRALWPKWAMLIIFSFIAFESTLLGAALKGKWFILIAPGVVCGVKALDTWRELRKQVREIVDRD